MAFDGPPSMGGAWTSKGVAAVGKRTQLNPGHELKWFETKQGKAVVNKLGDGGKDARMLSTNRKCTVESIVLDISTFLRIICVGNTTTTSSHDLFSHTVYGVCG